MFSSSAHSNFRDVAKQNKPRITVIAMKTWTTTEPIAVASGQSAALTPEGELSLVVVSAAD
jgi:hypothetical protein